VYNAGYRVGNTKYKTGEIVEYCRIKDWNAELSRNSIAQN
jgi:hypothetical protein